MYENISQQLYNVSAIQELIQNAEDAGATEVKFMYDEMEYGVESLWSPDMAQYQGNVKMPIDCNVPLHMFNIIPGNMQ